MGAGRYSNRNVIAPEKRLLAHVADRIDDSMLREIAEADYGMNSDIYLAGLRGLRDLHELPAPDWARGGWNDEVLELIRWSRPEVAGWRPGSEGERGHWMRAFCCTALMLRHPQSVSANNDDGGFNQTLAAWLDSIAQLDPSLRPAAAELLRWLQQAPSRPEDLAFLVLAELLVELMRLPADWDRCLALARRLPELVERMDREDPPSTEAREWWLFGWTHFNIRHDVWTQLVTDHMLNLPAHAPKWVAIEIAELGHRLLPPPNT
jgi:hypothetical protein